MDLASDLVRRAPAASRRIRAILPALLALVMMAMSIPAKAWWNPEWAYRKQITITADADPGAATGVPVLVRLHEGVLSFPEVAEDGADLRFIAEDDQTALRFHIEKFDPVFNLGFVWVRVPALAVGKPVVLWMYWGNPKAAPGSEPGETWDDGQSLVYHFGERGAPATDATSNRNDAATLLATEEAGIVGSSAKFDGQGVLALPASPSLALAAGGGHTVSMWVKPGAEAQNAVLYARRDATGSLVIGLAQGAPYVAIAGPDGVVQQTTPATALPAGEWHHLALTLAAQTTLYIGGSEVATLALQAPALATAATLGGEGGGEGVPVSAGFVGEIDEFRVAEVARGAPLLQLEARNQGPSDSMVQFGVDEAASTWSTGYMGVILASLTFDGWLAIGVLMVMMVISWYVMTVKARQIGQVAKANKIFMRAFRASGSDFAHMGDITTGAAAKLTAKELALMKRSPLLHVYKTGVDELRLRLVGDRKTDTLSTQSLAAIRASIDASIVHETQALGSQLVLLTIAISGGPFIGLLGTVVGVMITFAAVAAAGDVNINAIAPGISAALAATVAGLFVAIPALFGYNYLITRVKECSAEMYIFVDAFIARMAESYNDPAALRALGE